MYRIVVQVKTLLTSLTFISGTLLVSMPQPLVLLLALLLVHSALLLVMVQMLTVTL
jgi:hypothetical protein